MHGVWHGARVPAALPWPELLDPGWAAEGTHSWAPAAGLLTNSPDSRRGACIKFRM